MIRILAFAVALTVLAPLTPPAAAQTGEAYSPARAFEAFAPLIGRTWRGTGTGPDGRPVEDVARWEWAVGGHAVRVVHAVNGGTYGGDTLIGRDQTGYFFHYFTNGGFHTTGTITSERPGVFVIEQTVHGGPPMQLRSQCEMGADGVYRVRTSRLVDGEWKPVGGFDYREDPGANADLPLPPGTDTPG